MYIVLSSLPFEYGCIIKFGRTIAKDAYRENGLFLIKLIEYAYIE
ncbi:MAG: hypothetical protein ACJA1U_002960 [Bermanella sp.]|jgi:hypothetical protein